MNPEPYICAFCFQEPVACGCDRTEGGGHWLALSEAVRRRLLGKLPRNSSSLSGGWRNTHDPCRHPVH